MMWLVGGVGGGGIWKYAFSFLFVFFLLGFGGWRHMRSEGLFNPWIHAKNKMGIHQHVMVHN